MEFEDLQQIWNSQSNQPMYVINQDALHKRISQKREQARHLTNFSELLLIIVNCAAGVFVLGANFSNQQKSIALYAMAVWMFGTALYVLAGRVNRMKGNNQFDRSMLSDLAHAISVASYQVRLARLMRWNVVPIALLSLLGIWEGGKSIWLAAGVLIGFALAYYAGGWENNIYKSKKRELELLQSKLVDEQAPPLHEN